MNFVSRFAPERKALRVVDRRILPPVGHTRSPIGLTRIYVLVHGFNNDAIQAHARYEAFRRRIADLVGRDLQKIWDFYWPGYDDWISEPLRRRWKPLQAVNSLFTALGYHSQVPKAKTAGALLGEYITALATSGSSTEVVLIGHSLGCRVILEAIKYLATHHVRRHRVPAVCLMAAAVPIAFLEDPRELQLAIDYPARRIALYSRADTVLRKAFPSGQTLAREGRWPEAVGLFGNPRACFTARDETMLGHGEYWASSVTDPHVARVFGKTTAHYLPGFHLVPRELPQYPAPAEYVLPERPIGR